VEDRLGKLRTFGKFICIIAPKSVSQNERRKEKEGLKNSNLLFHTFNNRTFQFMQIQLKGLYIFSKTIITKVHQTPALSFHTTVQDNRALRVILL
jgi:hypothetical protein